MKFDRAHVHAIKRKDDETDRICFCQIQVNQSQRKNEQLSFSGVTFMKKLQLVIMLAALGISGAAMAQAYSVGTMMNPPENVTVVSTSSLIIDEAPASQVTAELTDRDCPAGTTLIFDGGDMNRPKCICTAMSEISSGN